MKNHKPLTSGCNDYLSSQSPHLSSYEFRLRMFTYAAPSITNRSVFGEFKNKNPMRSEYPSWTPSSIPVTQKSGETPFTLTEFNTGLFSAGNPHAYGTNWTEMKFRIGTQPGQSRLWDVLNVQITDACGNWIEKRNPDGQMVANTILMKQAITQDCRVVSLRGVLWPEEPAWRVRLEFCQRISELFVPEETWLLAKVPVPPEGGTSELQGSHSFSLGTMKAEKLTLTYPARLSGKPEAELFLNIDANTNRYRVGVARVINEQGEKGGVGVARMRGRGRASVPFIIPKGSKELDITLTMYGIHTVEFQAKPRLLHTNIVKSAL